MAEKTYRIKPLEWSDTNAGWSEAETPFGGYGVSMSGNGDVRLWMSASLSTTHSKPLPCVSIEDGKRLAQEHWEERLAGALEEVT